jgi:hypothetical protein
MKKLSLCVLFLTLACQLLQAQDTLPKFSVKNVGDNRIIVSWTNTFESIKQISIQRSFDSLTKYKTILSVPDPTTPQNGFADTKATNDHMFYRLFILLDKGVYLFSDAKRPVLDTMASIGKKDRLDVTGIKDSLGNLNAGLPALDVKNKPLGFVASKYVYTYKDGYVKIDLPENENLAAGKAGKKYSIKFFDDEEFLFELKDIKEKTFRIDKTNFYHGGWFKFELYEDGKLIEKNKFYLARDF